MSTSLVVPAGPYMGYELSELETELTNYKTARSALNTALTSATVNGQSFQFAQIKDQEAALNRKQTDILVAMAYLDPGRFPINPTTNVAAAVF